MDDRITFRCEDDLRSRFDDVCERYELTEAQLGRLLTRRGLTVIEQQGLDELVDQANGGETTDHEHADA